MQTTIAIQSGKIRNIKRDMNKKYARVCDITGEGMNEGWVWGDGVFYTKYEKDTLSECRKDRDAILFGVEELTINDYRAELYNEEH